MKALAAEMTKNFSKRLSWLGLKVRELTGDTQLSRHEIANTQVYLCFCKCFYDFFLTISMFFATKFF